MVVKWKSPHTHTGLTLAHFPRGVDCQMFKSQGIKNYF